MPVRIEPARSEDSAAIVRLLTESGLPVDGLLDHIGTALVARDENRIVGSAALEIHAEGALLRSVAVDAGIRGTGIGHQLTDSALALAKTLGMPAVYLLTTTAEHFFPRFAFEPVAREQVPSSVQQSVEFRSACPSTAVVMRRVLSRGE